MERQKHGFSFEQEIIQKYNLTPSTNYTEKWDGYYNTIPVSIKTEKLGSDIELADFRRNANNQDSFYLIVGFWEGNYSNIVETKILFINGKEWHNLFPNEFIDIFQNCLDSVSNDKNDDEKWKALIKDAKNQWQHSTKNLIRPRFKRDHKKQKRIQCAINNKDFYNYFIPKYGVESI